MLRTLTRVVGCRNSLLVAGSTLFACSAHAAAAHAAPAPAPTASGAAVVVGVSHRPGLGYAIAQRFAEGGMKVGIIGRQEEALKACKAAILAEVPSATVDFCVCDATDPKQVAAAFDGFKDAHGPCDALIYNLSSRPFPPTPIADVTPERARRRSQTEDGRALPAVAACACTCRRLSRGLRRAPWWAGLESDWKTGPYSALLCVQQVLPGMRARGAGSVIFTGASASLRGSARFGSFAVAKTGLRALAQSLAKEVATDGVHVSHVVIDCMVDMPVINQFFPDASKGRMLDTAAAADYYWTLAQQGKRCFAFETDLRPHESQW